MKSDSSQKILVIGAGASGLAAARLAASQQYQVTLLDEGHPRNLPELQETCRKSGITLLTDFHATALPAAYDTIILSPGIAAASRLGQLSRRSGVPVISELGYAARLCPWPTIGITGTNGKTTTVELLTHCLNQAGVRALAGGNIGLPLSQIILDKPELDVVVLEISTFQMEFTPKDFTTDAAVLLNITPDHLNRHGTYEAYQKLKTAVLHSCPAEKAVCNEFLPSGLDLPEQVTTFSAAESGNADFRLRNGILGKFSRNAFQEIISADDLPYSGRHNIENTLAVLAVADKMSISPERMLPGIRSFRTGPHRIETIAEHCGVTYIDDSKATNADAVIQALEALPEHRKKIHLIVGGADKGCDLKELIPYLQNCVKQVYLIGACRDRLAAAWQGLVPLASYQTLQDAVRAAAAAAVPGDAVLLSPACASQDMFRDYIQRGQVFSAEVAKVISDSQMI